MGSFRFVASGTPDCPAPRVLHDSYVRCLMQLHDSSSEADFPFDDFAWLFHSSTEIMGFVLDENGKVLSTGQASLIMTMPIRQVAINNVVTDQNYRGRGLGRLLEEGLLNECIERWNKPLKFSLTNAPKLKSAMFYIRLGWIYRGPLSQDPTVVFVKFFYK